MNCPKCGAKKAGTLSFGGTVYGCGSETDKRGKLHVATDCHESIIASLRVRIALLEEALSFVHASCQDLHHPKKYQHELKDPCPVVALVNKAKGLK